LRTIVFEKHIEDTIIAGDGLCDPKVVEYRSEGGCRPDQEIIRWGARFDKESDGDFKLGKEGGIVSSGYCIIKT
jgi:L-aspartate oxidase